LRVEGELAQRQLLRPSTDELAYANVIAPSEVQVLVDAAATSFQPFCSLPAAVLPPPTSMKKPTTRARTRPRHALHPVIAPDRWPDDFQLAHRAAPATNAPAASP